MSLKYVAYCNHGKLLYTFSDNRLGRVFLFSQLTSFVSNDEHAPIEMEARKNVMVTAPIGYDYHHWLHRAFSYFCSCRIYCQINVAC